MEPEVAEAQTEVSTGGGERRVAAPLLALLEVPLGHIAIGYWRRACFWFGLTVAVAIVGWLASFYAQPRLVLGALIALVILRLWVIADVIRLPRVHPLPGARSVLLITVGIAVFYNIISYKIRQHFVESFQIPSASMAPTLEVGDHIFARKTPKVFGRGDVVVFRYPLDPNTQYVKRIVAIGGDVVSMKAGQLSINDRPIERQPADDACPEDERAWCSTWQETLDGKSWRVMGGTLGKDMEPKVVPEGHFFLVGDNRDNSSDSRVWGTVAADLVEGRATLIWWSRLDGKTRWDRIGDPVR